MKEKMKSLLVGIVFMVIMMFSVQTVQARDNVTLPSLKDATAVVFHADVPDGFARDIAIYLNGSAYYMTVQSGYYIKIDLNRGTMRLR